MALDSVISQQSDKVSPQSTGGSDWAIKVAEEMSRPGGGTAPHSSGAAGQASGEAGAAASGGSAGGGGRMASGEAAIEVGVGAGAGTGAGAAGSGGIASGDGDAGTILQTEDTSHSGAIPGLILQDNRAIESEDQIKPAQEKNWTIAVDLGVSFAPDVDNPAGAGVNNNLAQLLKLAEQTKNSSVNFMVHAEQPLDQSRIKCDAFAEQSAQKLCLEGASQTNLAATERYFIHDGKVDILPDQNYKNPQYDLRALLTEAQEYAPSKNTGLIIDSHGQGAGGLYENTGWMTLDDLTKTVQNGLAGSGHTKLDFLDFDACDMADAKVIKQSSGIANDVVASAGVELVTPSHDSQNITASMSALLTNDKMSGYELGKIVVDQASMGANGEGQDVATPTLANFDLRHYGDFEKSLDDFGKALSDIDNDQHNAAILKIDTDLASVFNASLRPQEGHNRDIKTFTQNVLNDVNGHNFHGDTKSLEASANDLLKSIGQLAPQNFGEKTAGYENIGGLTAELPGSEILSREKLSTDINPLPHMTVALDTVLTKGYGFATKDRLLTYLENTIDVLPENVIAANAKQFRQIQEGINTIAGSNDELTFAVAVIGLKTKLSAMKHGPLSKSINALAPSVQETYLAKPVEEITPNWDNFIKKMKSHAS